MAGRQRRSTAKNTIQTEWTLDDKDFKRELRGIRRETRRVGESVNDNIERATGRFGSFKLSIVAVASALEIAGTAARLFGEALDYAREREREHRNLNRALEAQGQALVDGRAAVNAWSASMAAAGVVTSRTAEEAFTQFSIRARGLGLDMEELTRGAEDVLLVMDALGEDTESAARDLAEIMAGSLGPLEQYLTGNRELVEALNEIEDPAERGRAALAELRDTLGGEDGLTGQIGAAQQALVQVEEAIDVMKEALADMAVALTPVVEKLMQWARSLIEIVVAASTLFSWAESHETTQEEQHTRYNSYVTRLRGLRGDLAQVEALDPSPARDWAIRSLGQEIEAAEHLARREGALVGQIDAAQGRDTEAAREWRLFQAAIQEGGGGTDSEPNDGPRGPVSGRVQVTDGTNLRPEDWAGFENLDEAQRNREANESSADSLGSLVQIYEEGVALASTFLSSGSLLGFGGGDDDEDDDDGQRRPSDDDDDDLGDVSPEIESLLLGAVSGGGGGPAGGLYGAGGGATGFGAGGEPVSLASQLEWLGNILSVVQEPLAEAGDLFLDLADSVAQSRENTINLGEVLETTFDSVPKDMLVGVGRDLTRFLQGSKQGFESWGQWLSGFMSSTLGNIGNSLLTAAAQTVGSKSFSFGPFGALLGLGAAFSLAAGLIGGAGKKTHPGGVEPMAPDTLMAQTSGLNNNAGDSYHITLQTGDIFSPEESSQAVSRLARRAVRHGHLVANDLRV